MISFIASNKNCNDRSQIATSFSKGTFGGNNYYNHEERNLVIDS